MQRTLEGISSLEVRQNLQPCRRKEYEDNRWGIPPTPGWAGRTSDGGQGSGKTGR